MLKFNNGCRLIVGNNYNGTAGALIAVGTADSRIIFTSSEASPTPGIWGGISFDPRTHDETTIMEYCDISYGTYSNGGISTYYASPTIKNCAISYSSIYGIYVNNDSR